jgi:hypothetical protein
MKSYKQVLMVMKNKREEQQHGASLRIRIAD